MSIRDEKTTSLIAHLAGNYIAREAGRDALITVTRADISPDHKKTTVFVSVFPDARQGAALSFLERHTDEFRAYLKKEGRFSVLPHITFQIDEGEKHRQHIEEISREIEGTEERG